jgi:hypothetical protein
MVGEREREREKKVRKQNKNKIQFNVGDPKQEKESKRVIELQKGKKRALE